MPTAPTQEQTQYLMKRAHYKARQIARRYPALGLVEDVQHELIEDVLRRLPKFDGRRAGFKTFVCRLINNKIASMISSHDAKCRGFRGCRGNGSDCSLDDWVRDEDGTWVRRDVTVDAARLTARFGVVPRSAVDQCDLAADTAAVLATLSPEQRDLCERLQEQNPTEIARETGVARSLIYQRIAALRAIFIGAQMNAYV
jgi:RNA polymerase sigma factor (sigma-70 family)